MNKLDILKEYGDLCLDCCDLAFKDNSEQGFKDLGFDQVHFIKDTASSTELYVAANDDVCIVTFRATKDPEDWATNKDFNFIKRTHPRLGRYLVHDGFYKSYCSIIADLDGWLYANFLDPVSGALSNKKLIVTGHSLGGAIASLVWYHDVIDWQIDHCITFGAPRLLSSSTVKHMQDQQYPEPIRVVYAGDFITRVPFLWMDYLHMCKPVYFTIDKKCKPNGVGVWRDILEFTKDAKSEILKREIFEWEDHSTDLYRSLLRNIT